MQLSWKRPALLLVHAGGAITVIPPNIWQDNFLTGSTPFVVYPRVSAAARAPIAYGFQITPAQLPQVYTPQARTSLPAAIPKKLPANTVMDVNRYQKDLAALTPGHVVSALNLSAVDRASATPLFTPGRWAWSAIRQAHGRCRLRRHSGGQAAAITFPTRIRERRRASRRYTTFDSAGKSPAASASRP